MKVVFRVDASIQIGSGHVMRCLTLADALHEQGADVVFVCRKLPGHMSDVIANKGYRVQLLPDPIGDVANLTWNRHASWLGLPWEQDAADTLTVINAGGRFDWLIVDHYALDYQWEALMRSVADKIMVIDDLADRSHDCDLLLDQNFYLGMDMRYENLVPSSCRLLIGPKYALLRSEFDKARKKGRIRAGEVRNILVFYGGCDESNETAKALAAIQIAGLQDIEVDVLVGAANPHKIEIEGLCAKYPYIRFHCQVGNMADFMVRADLMLCAGGTTTWERCSVGLPGLVTATAVNQEELSVDCARAGFSLYLGTASIVTADRIAEVLRVLPSLPQCVQMLSEKGLETVDAKGLQRVAGILMPPEIVLRRATFDDCDSVYKWRNAEETRRYIFDQGPIPLEQHRSWYGRTMENPDRILLIGEISGKPVGVLRYDITDKVALISVYLVPGNQGQGVGTQLICSGSNWLMQHCPSIRLINAEIFSVNVASIKAFEQAGYKEHHVIYQKVLQ